MVGSDYPRVFGLLTVLGASRASDGTEASPLLADQHASSPHLTETVIHNLSHAVQHLKRLAAPDVQKDPEALAFNLHHAAHHTEVASDHAKRLRDHLMCYPSDPGEFTKQINELAELQDAPDDPDES